jgi:hypothetical protein
VVSDGYGDRNAFEMWPFASLHVLSIFTYLLNYSLAPCSTFLLVNLIVLQVANNFRAFCVNGKFIPIFPNFRLAFILLARSILYVSHPFHFLMIHLNDTPSKFHVPFRLLGPTKRSVPVRRHINLCRNNSRTILTG